MTMMQWCFKLLLRKKWYASRVVVEDAVVHGRVGPPAMVQVEQQKAPRVQGVGRADGVRRGGVTIFARRALDEQRAGAHVENGMRGEQIGLDEVLERGGDAAIALQLLVPPAIQGRKLRADRHFVDRRVELDPGVAPRKSAGKSES